MIVTVPPCAVSVKLASGLFPLPQFATAVLGYPTAPVIESVPLPVGNAPVPVIAAPEGIGADVAWAPSVTVTVAGAAGVGVVAGVAVGIGVAVAWPFGVGVAVGWPVGEAVAWPFGVGVALGWPVGLAVG